MRMRRVAVVTLITPIALFGCAHESSPPPPMVDAAVTPDARGAMLYENHCTICHTSVVHVRDTHRATSDVEVENWVRRWSADQKLGWSDEDVDDVTRYLLKTFYNF